MQQVFPFAFRGPFGSVQGLGQVEPVPPGPLASLDARLARAMDALPRDGVIGGALPFHPGDADHLWQAELGGSAVPRPALPLRPTPLSIRAEPAAGAYAQAVARALDLLAAGAGEPDGLRKIVLARSLAVRFNAPIDIPALLAALATDPAATAYHVALPPVAGAARSLVGATPELLLEKAGARVTSFPLAGSARRMADPVADADAAAGLARSDKDHREHRIVVEDILDRLAPHCRALSCPDGTGLTATRSMWHLGTRITGTLRDATTPAPLLAAALHPTPAVCGLPRTRAATLIGALEQVPRGFYAGTTGWCDKAGDGAWFVTIRCAEITGPLARLYAGAGIVPGSDPLAEVAETAAKFGALLAALGLPPDAGMTQD